MKAYGGVIVLIGLNLLHLTFSASRCLAAAPVQHEGLVATSPAQKTAKSKKDEVGRHKVKKEKKRTQKRVKKSSSAPVLKTPANAKLDETTKNELLVQIKKNEKWSKGIAFGGVALFVILLAAMIGHGAAMHKILKKPVEPEPAKPTPGPDPKPGMKPGQPHPAGRISDEVDTGAGEEELPSQMMLELARQHCGNARAELEGEFVIREHLTDEEIYEIAVEAEKLAERMAEEEEEAGVVQASIVDLIREKAKEILKQDGRMEKRDRSDEDFERLLKKTKAELEQEGKKTKELTTTEKQELKIKVDKIKAEEGEEGGEKAINLVRNSLLDKN